MKRAIAIMAGSLALAGGAGFLTSMAVGASPPAAQKTVTISITNGTNGTPGPPGPKGDTGPQGPPGAQECPTGFVIGEVVINHPGGQVTLYTCLNQ